MEALTQHATPEIAPYLASHEEERLAAIHDVEASTQAKDPNIYRMLRVLRNLLAAESACFSFITQSCITVKQADSSMGIEEDQPRPGNCLWALVPPVPQLVVIEDMRLDARTATSPWVLGEPHLRFYASVPLVTSNKLRMGTLCLINTKPTKFGSAQAAVLSNFAELLMWALEGAVMAKMPHSSMLAGEGVRNKKLYGQACALVDTSAPGWRILFANTPFTDLTGWRVEDASTFWTLVQTSGDEQEAAGGQKARAVDTQQTFSVCNLKLKAQALGRPRAYDAELRPATCSQLHEDAFELGNPSRYPGDEDSDPHALDMRHLYFLMLGPSQSGASRKGLHRTPVAGVTIGNALGAGDYAKVFRGTLQGEKIAVKVVKDPREAISEGGVPMEARLMQGVVHPHIVTLKTFKMAQTRAGEWRLWLMLEYCDGGTLSDAIDRGWLRTAPSPTAPTCLTHVATTVREMAEGLAYLHSRGILHCDISASNVMLQSSSSTPYGFSMKLSDFGFSREASKRYDNPPVTGNLSYTAPEVMRGQPCSKASDVYSLGILIVEMLTGSKAWGGLSHYQISYAVLNEGRKLTLPDPCAMGSLALRCLSHDPSERPSAAAVVACCSELTF